MSTLDVAGQQIDQIQALITPTLTQVYGDSDRTLNMVEYLAGDLQDREAGPTRQARICDVCWSWMTGGSTAQSVAVDIEQLLVEQFD
jgi:hypothetical protein